MAKRFKFIRWLGTLLTARGSRGLLTRVAFFLIIMIPVIALSVYGYKNIYDSITDSAISERKYVAHLSAILLKERLDKLVDLGISLASRPSIVNAITEGDWNSAIGVLKKVPEAFPFIDHIFLSDVNGNFMASIPEASALEGENFAFRDWYKGVSYKWQPYVSEIYRRAIEPKRNIISIAIPVKISYSAEPQPPSDESDALGIVVLQIKPETFFEWTKEADIGPGSFIYAINKNGHIVFHPKFQFKDEVIDYSDMPTTRELLAKKSGIKEFFSSFEKEMQLVAYEPIEKYNWGVAIVEPAKTVFASRNRSLALAIIIYSLFIFLSFSIAYLVLRIVSLHREIEVDLENHSKNLEDLVTKRTGELRENEERFRATFEQAAVGFAQVGLDGRWILVNQKLCDIVGYTKDEMLNLRFQDITNPNDMENDLANMNRLLAGEASTYVIEKRYICKDGRNIWTNSTASIVRDVLSKSKYFIYKSGNYK